MRAVLFDLDETLIPEDEPLHAAYGAMTEEVEALRAAVRELWRREAPAPDYRAQVNVSASDGLSADFAGDHPALAEIRAFLPGFRAAALGDRLAAWRRARWAAQ